MKRFLSFICLSFVALAAYGCCEAPVVKQPQPKKVAIQLYSVLSSVSAQPEATIERLSKLGYNQVELVQWGGDPNVFGMTTTDFKAICDKYGVEIISTHSGIQEETENEEAVLARWRAAFEAHKACGGRYFIIPGYSVDYTVEDVQRMCDYFNKIGKIAKEEYGLMLGYHNHSYEFGTLKDMPEQVMWEYLVENTNPEYVCFELDVYLCHLGGKLPEEYLAKYPDRIKLLHVKDEFVVGESGEVNFDAIFTRFFANGMTEYIVEIEAPERIRQQINEDGTQFTQEQVAEATFDAAEKSINYLLGASFMK